MGKCASSWRRPIKHLITLTFSFVLACQPPTPRVDQMSLGSDGQMVSPSFSVFPWVAELMSLKTSFQTGVHQTLLGGTCDKGPSFRWPEWEWARRAQRLHFCELSPGLSAVLLHGRPSLRQCDLWNQRIGHDFPCGQGLPSSILPISDVRVGKLNQR